MICLLWKNSKHLFHVGCVDLSLPSLTMPPTESLNPHHITTSQAMPFAECEMCEMQNHQLHNSAY